MLESVLTMFSYPFLIRALIAGVSVALASSLLGTTLVLKRYSMIGDGLSHVSFGCLAVAAALNWAPLALTLPVVSAAAFLLLKLNNNKKIFGDAAIALITCAALAVGVIVISVTTGMNVDVYNYMFGSILSITKTDMIVSVTISSSVILVFVLLFHRIFAVTFDEPFSKATGLKTGAYQTLFALSTAVTIVIGMRLVGALLISGLLIFPPLSAMRVCKTFKSTTIFSAILSVLCFFAGLVLSFLANLPAGATVIVMNAAVFCCLFAFGKLVYLIRKYKSKLRTITKATL